MSEDSEHNAGAGTFAGPMPAGTTNLEMAKLHIDLARGRGQYASDAGPYVVGTEPNPRAPTVARPSVWEADAGNIEPPVGGCTYITPNGCALVLQGIGQCACQAVRR